MSGRAFERQIAHQHPKENNPHRPHIHLSVYLFVFTLDETLRRHVVQAASVHVLDLKVGCNSGYSEVDNFDFLLLVI